MISDVQNASDNLINAPTNSENLINAHKDKKTDEIFLISESLRKPLLNIANKLLG
jgi:hypothetical protein